MAPSRFGLRTALAAAAVLSGLTAASAVAGPPVGLSGSPLNVFVGEQGQLQAFREGQPSGIFYAPGDQAGDAGFFLAFPDETQAPSGLDNKTFGFQGSAGPGLGPDFLEYTTGTQGPVTGSGSAADPRTQVTTYRAGGNVLVTQTTTYVNGSQEFRVRWDVRNNTGAPLAFRALTGADFFFDGNDAGTGIFTEGPPRFIGGTNPDTGNSGGFVEILGSPSGTPAWSRYQALEFGGDPDQIWGKIEAAGADGSESTPVFDNTVNGEPTDNAGGVEWDQPLTTPLANNATRSFELLVRSAVPSALQLNPTNAGAPQGVPINITATAVDTSGQPYAGKTLRWTITGANPGSGSAPLNSAGSAVITDPGTNAGGDTIIAFVDFNNNGTREPAEPQASALANFVDNIAPDCRVKVTGSRTAGAGNPLVITVNCDSQATVTMNTTLVAPRRRPSGSATASARRKLKIKLPRKKATVFANTRTPLKIKIPKRIARKYGGRTFTARVKATVVDTAGNRAVDKAKRKIKIKRLKKKRRRG